mmetsp:Transcript_102285/g.220781  ORF Transcript_102285/g.220781 Transcript_102285/m.220781 type:complete len:246 (-) Transcript_102285:123-860(-)
MPPAVGFRLARRPLQRPLLPLLPPLGLRPRGLLGGALLAQRARPEDLLAPPFRLLLGGAAPLEVLVRLPPAAVRGALALPLRAGPGPAGLGLRRAVLPWPLPPLAARDPGIRMPLGRLLQDLRHEVLQILHGLAQVRTRAPAAGELRLQPAVLQAAPLLIGKGDAHARLALDEPHVLTTLTYETATERSVVVEAPRVDEHSTTLLAPIHELHVKLPALRHFSPRQPVVGSVHLLLALPLGSRPSC